MQLDVQMLTVHTSGGFEMLKAAEQAAEEVAWKVGRTPPLSVLGVTVLTSLNAEAALREIGLDANVEYQVRLSWPWWPPRRGCAGWFARLRTCRQTQAPFAAQHAVGHAR